jgi:hypothetical protein
MINRLRAGSLEVTAYSAGNILVEGLEIKFH